MNGENAMSSDSEPDILSPVFNRSQSRPATSDLDEDEYIEEREHILDLWQQLEAGQLPEYRQAVKKLEAECRERRMHAEVAYSLEKAMIEQEYRQEKRAAEELFQNQRQDLLNMLTAELEEKKRIIEFERDNFDLSFAGNVKDVKTGQKRKLRRRHLPEAPPLNSSASSTPEQPADTSESPKRQCPAPAPLPLVLNHLLADEEIEEDLAVLAAPCEGPRQRGVVVVDGVLFFNSRSFSRGIRVAVDSREAAAMRFCGEVTSVSPQEVVVRRSSDGAKVRVPVKHLKTGRLSLKRKN